MKHSISYPTKSSIFCNFSFGIKQEFLIVYSSKFICASIVSFYADITEIGTRSYHCRFIHSKPDKESHAVVKKIVLIRCRKWISFQSAEYSHY